MNMWANRQFWLDSSWRAFRTFCQTLAGLLLTVQTASQVSAMSPVSIPWYGYLYASAVAAFISLLQSIDRERVAVGAGSTGVTPVAAPLEFRPVSGQGYEVQPLGYEVRPSSGDPASADYNPMGRYP